MILYHGTNQDIDAVDLTKGMLHKDFGQGFYLTPNYDTACRMAKKKVRLMQGNPIVIVYELDEVALQNGTLCVLRFPEKATEEWARFIDLNRNRGNLSLKSHHYDVVCGPIADDGVAYSLARYHEGTKTLKELAADLQDIFLDQQVMIGSQRALAYLKKIKTERI